MMRCLLCVMFFLALVSCTEIKDEQHLFVVNIDTADTKLQEYLNYHNNIWPEVEAGFKKAGYREIKLFRFQHLIVMSVTVPEGADLAEMGKLAEASNKRCAEWNQLMDTYQMGVPGTAEGQKWVEVTEFYSFKNPD